MYTTFWPDSAAVAAELATEAKLASVMADINAHHYAVAIRLGRIVALYYHSSTSHQIF